MLYFICSSLFCASSCDNIFFSLSYLQGKASGNKPALWLRSKIQTQLFQLGSNIQKNAGIFLFVGLLILAIFTFSLKNATLETRVEKLWVQGKPIFFILWLTMGWNYIWSSISIFQSMSCTHNPRLDLSNALSMDPYITSATDWMSGSRKLPVLLMFSTVFLLILTP